MLFKGTEKRSAKKIALDIESYGGYLNAFTSKEHTCYYGRGLTENLERTFDVISDMIQHPAFKETEIKKESQIIIDELMDIDDNPEELIFDKFEEILYSGNTLSMPIIGTEKNIKVFNQSDLFRFVEEKYGFNNLIIAASGNVKHEELLRLTDKYFTKNLGSKNIKRKNAVAAPATVFNMKKAVQQVHVLIGSSTYGYCDKKRITANILSHILGEGSSSRLFQTIREKNGIAYQLNTFLNSFYDVSSLGVYLSTNEKQAEKAQALVYSEFSKIKEKPVPGKELNRAKEYIIGNMMLGLESTSSRMFRMANSELYFNRFISPDEMVKLINSITAQEILELANEVFEENTMTRVIISPNNLIMKTAA